ncbi:hypothetical protein HELRODRAFT_174049 [Helobdella robusta]|uniref:Uncharacterized protein n=1 Tax=Helobdella robusta TaxID=6412 RepID=T1F7J1_HELRO|nr:hypothetical protein HELRODRAFT_174049 [Helobdella robusta]ESO03155.1 hypothetical protein HELRODRAFT_174049 [Helobdella robusta]
MFLPFVIVMSLALILVSAFSRRRRNLISEEVDGEKVTVTELQTPSQVSGQSARNEKHEKSLSPGRRRIYKRRVVDCLFHIISCFYLNDKRIANKLLPVCSSGKILDRMNKAWKSNR